MLSWYPIPAIERLRANTTDLCDLGLGFDCRAFFQRLDDLIEGHNKVAPNLRLNLMYAKPDMLCNSKNSVYRSRMDKDRLENFKLRLTEAIKNGPASQTRIAEYCGISVQSVNGWKRTGQISKDNLRKLSEISGYRYLYLLNGEEPKTYSDSSENAFEMGISDRTSGYGVPTDLFAESHNARKLVQNLTHALANGRLSEESIGLLADFIKSLVNNSKP